MEEYLKHLVLISILFSFSFIGHSQSLKDYSLSDSLRLKHYNEFFKTDSLRLNLSDSSNTSGLLTRKPDPDRGRIRIYNPGKHSDSMKCIDPGSKNVHYQLKVKGAPEGGNYFNPDSLNQQGIRKRRFPCLQNYFSVFPSGFKF
jgi:hypothetical protein